MEVIGGAYNEKGKSRGLYLCAAIWITRVILDVVYQKSGALLALNFLCVVLWIAVSVINLKRCRLDKEER